MGGDKVVKTVNVGDSKEVPLDLHVKEVGKGTLY